MQASPTVNGPANEVGPAFLADEGGVPVLYFTSTRRGNADIYRSTVTFAADGSITFGGPSFVAELNSATEDARPAIRNDGLEVVFHSRRARLPLAPAWPVSGCLVSPPLEVVGPSSGY
jgi:hypothetical protein